MAITLRSSGLTPQLVICSPSVRTVATYEAIRPAIPAGRLRLDPEVYLATADQLLTILEGVDPGVSSLLLIGHNPGVSELLALLDPSGAATVPDSADLPTAALVHLEVTGPWSTLPAGTAALQSVYRHRGVGTVRS